MCGLVGVINTSSSSLLSLDKYFKNALLADAVRGIDSTGILAVDNNFKCSIIKAAIEPAAFIKIKEVTEVINKLNLLLMGHNRFATKGKVGNETSHPFHHGKIILAHNGTLFAHKNLCTGASKFEVDSEAICYLLNQEEDTIKALEKLDGAFALSWYNSSTKEFNLARNSERTLYFAELSEETNKGVFLYASEKGMLSWLADRNSIKIKEITPIEVGKIYSFDLTGKNREIKITDFTPKPQYDYSGYHNYYKYYNYPTKTNLSNNSNTIRVGSEIYVSFNTLTSYNKNSNFYYAEGKYKQHTCIVNGLTREEGKGLLSGMNTKVKVNGITNHMELLCTPIKENKVTNLVKKNTEVCWNCGKEIESGIEVFRWNGLEYCDSCILEHADIIGV